MSYFNSFQGKLTMINEAFRGANTPSGCYLIMTLENSQGSIVNFIVSPTTYFVDNETLEVGDLVEGFYDMNAPTPLIYPPQFQAIVMAKVDDDEFVTVDYFYQDLTNESNTLKLNISPDTEILLTNNQRFLGRLANRDLVVVYEFTTRSIPAQTTPKQVIVLC